MMCLLTRQTRHCQKNTVDGIRLFLFNAVMNKQCFKCKETKPISEFYKHPRMGDGHLGKCKTCAKRDVWENLELLKNDPNWVFGERARSRIRQAKYRRLGLAHPTSSHVKLKWVRANPHKKKAHGIAALAVKNGQIEMKTKCESCGESGKLQKHHPDYSLPKLVVWLCTKCHGISHRKPFGSPLP